MTTEIMASLAVLFGIAGMFISGILIVRGFGLAWISFTLGAVGCAMGTLVLAGG